MIQTDGIKMKFNVEVTVRDRDGVIKQVIKEHNLVTTAGKSYLATWLAAASQAGKFMSYIGVGTGTTAAAAGDTTLETEVETRSLGTLTASTNTWNNTATITATGTHAITEAGLFSASSSGTMLARVVFAAANLVSGDGITVNWTVTFS